MPYLEQTRTAFTSNRSHAVYFGQMPGVNRILDQGTQHPQDWKRDYLYGYRSKGVSPSGQSLEYENLSGRDLRSEIIAQGHRSSSYDTGHPGKISHDLTRFHEAYTTVSFPYGGKTGTYSGTIWWWPNQSGRTPTPWAAFLPAEPGWTSQAIVNGWGSRAIKRYQPLDKSSLALLVSLVEIYKDGLPKIPALRTLNEIRGSRKVYSSDLYAGEFLNAQFGWSPMVSDMKGCAELVLRAGEQFNRLKKNASFSRRGSGVLDVSTSSRSGQYSQDIIMEQGYLPGYSYPMNLAPYIASSSGTTVTWLENSTTTVRFSGAFEYYFGGFDRLQNSYLARAEKLLGLELTPETAWQTQPWTWLLDWFGNIGGVISNAVHAIEDSSVMKYGYLMIDTVANRSESARIPLKNGGAWISVIHGQSLRYQRERATPYGFGLNPSAFSDRQWAILAALGLTRASKVLRLSEP